MTKTGILALSTVAVVILIIGIVGFVTTSPKKTTVEVTPRPKVQENVASPSAAKSSSPSGVLSGKEARLQLPSQSDGGQATSSARRVVK